MYPPKKGVIHKLLSLLAFLSAMTLSLNAKVRLKNNHNEFIWKDSLILIENNYIAMNIAFPLHQCHFIFIDTNPISIFFDQFRSESLLMARTDYHVNFHLFIH